MVRFLAIIFGIVFIFIGVAGFLPTAIQNGMLFGYFDATLMHNMAYLIAGVLAIMAATNYRLAKIFFALIGIIFTAAALLGFWRSGDLFFLRVNMADNVMHLIVGVIALYLGFSSRSRED